jgi:hypothetical protein
VVVWGETLPGSSAPIRWIGATHISDKILHFAAYFGLAFIPVLGFRLWPGTWTALAMVPLGVALALFSHAGSSKKPLLLA